MSDIEGRGLQMMSHTAESSPRLRPPSHHGSVRVGIASRRAWITFAGLLLLLSAAVGFYTSAQLFVQASEPGPGEGPAVNAEVAGVVTESDGDVIAGATITIVEMGNLTTTNADGWYSFGEVPPGSYTFEASAPGYQTVAKPLVIEPALPRIVGFALERGSGRVELPAEEPPNFQNPAAGALALAVAVLFASGMAAAGGLSAIRHRHYLVAVTGAAAGVLTLGYFIGSIAAIVALAILASLRHGFREAEYHHLPWEEAPEDGQAEDQDGEPADGAAGEGEDAGDAPGHGLPPPPGATEPPLANPAPREEARR